MSVYFDYQTGPPTREVDTLVRRISAFVRSVQKFKIGISNDPDRRWSEAYKYYYDDMIVLYGSSSIQNVSILESSLIEKYRWCCDNLVAGGGGSIGRPPYYLYLVRRHG